MPRSPEVFCWIIASVTLSYFARIGMSTAGPSVMREFGLSETQLGMVYSASTLGYFLCMLPAGWLSDRFGARLIVAVAAAGSALVTAAVGLLPAAISLSSILLLRFLFGAFAAPVFPAAGALTVGWFRPARYGIVQAAAAAATGLGGMIAPVTVVALIALRGWRFAFLCTGAATLLFAAFWFMRIRDRRPLEAVPAAGRDSRAILLRHRPLWVLTAAYACAGFFSTFFDNWIYHYFTAVRHYGDAASAWFTSATQAVLLVSVPLGGLIVDRLPAIATRRTFVLAAHLTSAGLLAAAVAVNAQTPVVTLFCLAYAFMAMTDSCFAATALVMGGKTPASAYSLMNTGWALGALLGPSLIPALAGVRGWNAAVYFAAFVIVLSALLWYAIPSFESAPRLTLTTLPGTPLPRTE